MLNLFSYDDARLPAQDFVRAAHGERVAPPARPVNEEEEKATQSVGGVIYVRPSPAPAPNDDGSAMVTKLASEQTGGAFCLREATVPPGSGSPTGSQPENALFYVLDGVLRFTVDSRPMMAAPGTCLFIPRGIPYRWTNRTSIPARMLITDIPASRHGRVRQAIEQEQEQNHD